MVLTSNSGPAVWDIPPREDPTQGTHDEVAMEESVTDLVGIIRAKDTNERQRLNSEQLKEEFIDNRVDRQWHNLTQERASSPPHPWKRSGNN